MYDNQIIFQFLFSFFLQGPQPVDEKELEERLAMLIAPQMATKPSGHQLPQEQDSFLPLVRQSQLTECACTYIPVG